jgi:hypothetical protein
MEAHDQSAQRNLRDAVIDRNGRQVCSRYTFTAKRFSRVLGMLSSLEVQVLRPT